jgi:hypothetical protein
MKLKYAVLCIKNFGNSYVGVMTDKQGKLQVIDVTYQNGINAFCFDSYNENIERTSYMQLSNNEFPPNRLYLSQIFTMQGQNGKGLASNANEFAEFIMNNKIYDSIYGIFCPEYFGENCLKCSSNEEFEKLARIFYKKNGYEVLTLNDFLKFREKYPFLSEDDFKNCGEKGLPLVAKMINKQKTNNSFENINGVLVRNDVPEQIKEEIDSLQM